MKKQIALLMTVVVSACSGSGDIQSDRSKEIWQHLQTRNYESIDFSQFGSDEWTRVCFLGPYNADAEKTLGFPWRVSDYTDVLDYDGYNVILFATSTKVVEYVVHRRDFGDFWKISGQCLDREHAFLIRDEASEDWKNYIIPMK